jgi:hypothetical protein
MGLEYQIKTVKALYASGNAATRYSATQSIQTALSGSSYILMLLAETVFKRII